MATKRPTGARNETIRCENCGEYYSVTYKRCPFCDERVRTRSSRPSDREEFEDEYENEFEDERGPRGGRRLVTNTRGGGYGRQISLGRIIWTVVTLLIIAAAVYIVFTAVYPLIARGKPGTTPPPPVSPPATSQVSPSAAPGTTPAPSDQPVTSEPPAVTPTPPPAGSDTATGLSLGQQDFSLTDAWPTYTFKVTFTPAGTTGAITWTSSKPDIVVVDQSGKVSPGSTQGTATVTAALASGYSQSCIVRNQVTSSTSGGSGSTDTPTATLAPSATPAPSTKLTLNTSMGTDGVIYDFSLGKGESYTLKVKGTESAVSWSVKDSSVATVSDKGVVTGVSKGTTRLYAKVDGQTLESIVRVSG